MIQEGKEEETSLGGVETKNFQESGKRTQLPTPNSSPKSSSSGIIKPLRPHNRHGYMNDSADGKLQLIKKEPSSEIDKELDLYLMNNPSVNDAVESLPSPIPSPAPNIQSLLNNRSQKANE
jgi:hypothetical protein